MKELEDFLESLDTFLYDNMLVMVNHENLNLMSRQGLDFPNQSDQLNRLMVNNYQVAQWIMATYKTFSIVKGFFLTIDHLSHMWIETFWDKRLVLDSTHILMTDYI